MQNTGSSEEQNKQLMYTAISRKVVEKRARDNPEWYCGWFWVHCFSEKFERMAEEAVDICLRVLKESNKSRFDIYGVRNSVLNISNITFRDCRVHFFSDNLSRSSCILKKLWISTAIHLWATSSAKFRQFTSKMTSWFVTTTNKEISQIWRRSCSEKHEEGDKIRFGSFYR